MWDRACCDRWTACPRRSRHRRARPAGRRHAGPASVLRRIAADAGRGRPVLPTCAARRRSAPPGHVMSRAPPSSWNRCSGSNPRRPCPRVAVGSSSPSPGRASPAPTGRQPSSPRRPHRTSWLVAPAARTSAGPCFHWSPGRSSGRYRPAHPGWPWPLPPVGPCRLPRPGLGRTPTGLPDLDFHRRIATVARAPRAPPAARSTPRRPRCRSAGS